MSTNHRSTNHRFVRIVARAAGTYAWAIRPRIIRWGATDEELARPFPGADLVPGGERAATMAVTIDARPEEVWPWIVQMGWGRGGWYSWDRLDNAGRPSAREVHAEWQDVKVGSYLQAWSSFGATGDFWEVAALEPNRFLALRGLVDLKGNLLDPERPRPHAYVEGLWGFLLEQEDGGRTRLIIGGYQVLRPRWMERIVNYWIYPPVVWIMQARMLRVLKRNIESAAHASPIVDRRAA